MRQHLRRCASSLVLLSGGSGELRMQHIVRRDERFEPMATLVGVGRAWLGVFAVVAVALVAAAVVVGFRHGGSAPVTPKPGSVDQSQRYGDDADLMQRRERKKLVQRSQ